MANRQRKTRIGKHHTGARSGFLRGYLPPSIGQLQITAFKMLLFLSFLCGVLHGSQSNASAPIYISKTFNSPEWKAFKLERYARRSGAPLEVAQTAARAALAAAGAHSVVTPPLIFAVASKESEWNPKARNKKSGCVGLMQVDPDVWSLPRSHWYSITNNIHKGAEILRLYTTRYGLRGGLHAYNVGETDYLRGKRNHRYVNDVLKERNHVEKG